MAQKAIKRYPFGYEGRDIIDDIVLQNSHRNKELYVSVCNIPKYFGAVHIGENRTTLKTVTGKKLLVGQKLISDVVYNTENLQLEPGTGVIQRIVDNELMDFEVHPKIIKFIKSSIACSYNPNMDFNTVVTACAKAVINNVEKLCLPLDLPAKNKTQKLIAAELNEYLKQLCDETGTKYTEEVDGSKKKKRKVSDILDSVTG